MRTYITDPKDWDKRLSLLLLLKDKKEDCEVLSLLFDDPDTVEFWIYRVLTMFCPHFFTNAVSCVRI